MNGMPILERSSIRATSGAGSTNNAVAVTVRVRPLLPKEGTAADGLASAASHFSSSVLPPESTGKGRVVSVLDSHVLVFGRLL